MAGTPPDNADCVHAYTFDGGNADDTVGSMDGVVSGATNSVANGILNEGYGFDGNDEIVITVADTGWFGTTQSHSISMWLKTSNNTRRAAYRDRGDDGIIDIGFKLDTVTNEIQMRVWNDGVYTYLDTGVSNDGNWHHFLFTIDDGVAIKVYVDGNPVAVATEVIDAMDSIASGTGVWFGSWGGGTFWLGAMDEPLIFDTVLVGTNATFLYNGGSPTSDQQYPFTSDSVILVTPNGGESLVVGKSYEITWTDTGTVGNLHVEFSDDNGVGYSTVIASTPNDGSYDWTVPSSVSDLCLIKLTDVGDPGITDVSDAVFSIIPPPEQTTGGGSFVQSWLLLVDSIISGAVAKIVEMSNTSIKDYLYRPPHRQITGDFEALVVKVSDGDTVRLRADFRDFDFPLRLANIDAPEMNSGGEFARDWLSERILGKKVNIIINPNNRVGKYGRLIGEVFVDGFNVNDEMMRQFIVMPFGQPTHRLEPIDKIMRRFAIE